MSRLSGRHPRMIYTLPVTVLIALWPSPAAFPQFYFVENAKERGIDFLQRNGSLEKEYIVEAKGAGVAVADVNGDGWDDIYLVNGAPLQGEGPDPQPRNQLFMNQGDGTFLDGTDASGLGDTGFGTGAYFADVDNDGDLDCYLTNYGPNQLYINDGQGHFTAVPDAGGAQNTGWSTGAAFADINGDGFLDLYVANYAIFSPEIAEKKGKLAPFHGHLAFIGPSSFEPADDNLFLNDGHGRFVDVSKARGIQSCPPGRGFTVLFTDLDDDGDLDIYVANDTTANHLFENDGKGYFEDIALLANAGLDENGEEQGGMGAAVRDVDGDLDLDIAVANYQDEYNILYRNDGRLQFTDASFVSGIAQGTRPYVSFGLLLEDFNNDSWDDMFISTGHVYPITDQLLDLFIGYAQYNLLFYNQGKGRFKNVSEHYGPVSSRKSVSRGCAAADFDRDGDLDIIINNLDSTPLFFENQSPSGNWLEVCVQDERGMPAYGARVQVNGESRSQIVELYSSASFLSQSSAALHFGLGKDQHIKSIQIRWPDGSQKEFKDIPINRRVIMRKNSGEVGYADGSGK